MSGIMEIPSESEVLTSLLTILNKEDSLKDLARDVTTFLKDWLGCDAVGLRLRDATDFPYFETLGFPEEFVETERSLCSYNETRKLRVDGNGLPILECMCGNVIMSHTDPAFPFFTPKGSFWSNGTTALLAATTEADRQASTRNRCNGQGYESVGLFPLRIGNEPFGLIQVNDKRIGFFTHSLVELLERISDHVVMAVSERLVRQRLHDSLMEKEILLKELHHRVKNNFEIISSLLYLTSQEGVPPEAEKVLFDARRRLFSISLTHNELYENKYLHKIDMIEHVGKLVTYIGEAYGESKVLVTTSVTGTSVVLDIEQAVPCSLALSELISNAFRHAFQGRETGTLYVIMSETHGDINLSVRDNGVGIPKGFSFEENCGMGLTLVKNLIERQLRGNLTISGRPGTDIMMTFKKTA
jgi:two-component sensor histidine kinase